MEGFKSYQKHTDIVGFSPQFNAITGYNGSGKSNVLDSICFILGINKLDNIRAKSMSELITHGGTKATVSIRFDNRDKSTSPYNMENCDEIVVQRTITAQATGKGCATNYTLNGHAATNSRIQDFFRGVGLNVNNPHFLIMQGRITTVLNMKPEEILGMVEEAAGTKMYDQKKKEAEKTIFMKETKLKEIDRIFEGSIDPRMEKFREDRKNMVEVTRLGKLKENCNRKLEAYVYYMNIEAVKREQSAIEDCQQQIVNFQKKIDEFDQQVIDMEKSKEDMEKDRDSLSNEEPLCIAQKATYEELAKAQAEKRDLVDMIKQANKDRARLTKSIADDSKLLEKKRKELEATKSANGGDIDNHRQKEQLVEQLREELEALTRGTIANEKGEHVSVETLIQNTKSEAARLEAEVKVANNRRGRVESRLHDMRGELAEEAKKIDRTQLDAVKATCAEIQKKMSELGFDAEENEKIRQEYKRINDRVTELDVMINKALSQAADGRYALNYTPPPVTLFNPKTDIIGYIAHVMKIKPGKEHFGAAVDVAAGGMYGHVVVKSQEIARLLIDSKAFAGRRTMIPVEENDRADSGTKRLDAKGMETAHKIAEKYGETVTKYMDLIEFPKEIDNTFISHFGHLLVVESLDCAKEIAYHPNIKTRVLTRSGDDVKPTGVMTGGHVETGEASVLVDFRPFHKLKEESKSLEPEIEKLKEIIDQTEPQWRKYNELKACLKASSDKAEQLEKNMRNSRFGLVEKDIKEAVEELEQIRKDNDEKTVKCNELKAKMKEYESKRNTDKGSQEKRKKEITAKLQEAEKAASSNKDSAEKARRAVLQLQAQVDDLVQSVASETAQLEDSNKKRENAEQQMPLVDQKCQEKEDLDNAAKKAIGDARKKTRGYLEQINTVVKDIDSVNKEKSKTLSKIADKGKEIKAHQEAEKLAKNQVIQMLKKNEWLEEEQAHFNKRGGLYDFDGYSQKKGSDEMKELDEKISQLERSLCMKNVSNLDSCEARVIDIKNKRERLVEDFNMLQKTIKVLDKKKVDELMRAHESVNRDFGKIFNCLLPDATAKLMPPEGKTVVDGLEVKVAFNGVEKDSLQELSGGQRSLVALSLILAMLKFKPAPLYILDEVDAALDLSHTANIGMMIKTHFRDHQFIIVSLKQGMFSNADSLFQTSFADGHSSCRLLTGDALLKAKNDTKLAAQAAEMEDASKANKKAAAKKPQKKAGRQTEDEE